MIEQIINNVKYYNDYITMPSFITYKYKALCGLYPIGDISVFYGTVIIYKGPVQLFHLTDLQTYLEVPYDTDIIDANVCNNYTMYIYDDVYCKYVYENNNITSYCLLTGEIINEHNDILNHDIIYENGKILYEIKNGKCIFQRDKRKEIKKIDGVYIDNVNNIEKRHTILKKNCQHDYIDSFNFVTTEFHDVDDVRVDIKNGNSYTITNNPKQLTYTLKDGTVIVSNKIDIVDNVVGRLLNCKINYPNGDIFTGDITIINDTIFLKSRGILKYKNGDVYDGEFIYNVPHGQCVYKFKNGNVYIGYINLGKFTIYGTLYNKDMKKQKVDKRVNLFY